MTVAGGRTGNVTVYTATQDSSGDVPTTVAEMGEWSINAGTRNIIEYYSFGDTIARSKPGLMTAQTFTFSGYYDESDDDGQRAFMTALSSGGLISNSTVPIIKQLRLWGNDDTTITAGYGYFSCTNSSGAVIITNYEVGANKDGIGTINFTGAVTSGVLEWSTEHNT